MARPRSHTSATRVKGGLAVSYAALTLAIVTAYTNPATGYELSIYAGRYTPLSFWAGTAIAIAVALLVALYSGQRSFRSLGLLLGGASLTAVVGLPLIRGYYFYGQTDSLIHLGWTRAMASGGLDPTSILYPGSHVAAILIGDVAGYPYRRSLVLLVVVLSVVYFVFVPLTVRLLVNDRVALTIATFSGLMLLPLNNVSTFLRFHTFSLTLLFLPVVFYLLLRHLLSGTRTLGGLADASGLTLFLAGVVVLFLHPQAMLNLLVLVGAIVAYQFYRRRHRSDRAGNDVGAVTMHFLLLGGLFFIWITDHWALYTTLEQTQTALLNFVEGGSADQIVNQRTESAATIGVNLPGLFVKLFVVSVVYFGLASTFVVSRISRRQQRDPTGTGDVYAYFFYGALGLLPLVLINYLGKVSTYFFRHVGFGMVLATIIGAVAIRHYAARAAATIDRVPIRPVVAVVLALGLVISLAALFPSPFIHLPNHHVTAAQMTGYDTAFEHQPAGASVWFGGIRTTTNRYESAHPDAPYSIWSGAVPGRVLSSDIGAYYRAHEEPTVRRDHYLVVTTYDVQREVNAYRELRYTARDLDAIEHQRGVHRIAANGEFTLYYVDVVPDSDG